MQEESVDTLFVVGHNPQLRDLLNTLLEKEHISKLPALGVAAVTFDISDWSELEENSGKLDFFIYPKQFHYYMPEQIRAVLKR